MRDRLRHEWETVASLMRTMGSLLIETHFGPQCDEYDDGCPVCNKWWLLEALTKNPYDEEGGLKPEHTESNSEVSD